MIDLKPFANWLREKKLIKFIDTQDYLSKMQQDTVLVVKVIIMKAGKILILRDANTDYWDLPGGHIQEDETLEEGARREVKEEIGTEIDNLKELGVKEFQYGEKKRPTVVYTAELKDKNKDISLSVEHFDFQWVYPGEYGQYNLRSYLEILDDFFFGNENDIAS